MNRKLVSGLALFAVALLIVYLKRGESSASVRRQAYTEFASHGTPEQVKAWVDQFHDECFSEAYGYEKTGRRHFRGTFNPAVYRSLMTQKIGSAKAIAGLAARRAESAAQQDADWNHEIRLDRVSVAAVTPGQKYRVSLDVYDQRADLTPDERPLVRYQLSCPGGGAIAGGAAPSVVMNAGDWHFSTAAWDLDLSSVNKGTSPCQLAVSIGHKDGARSKNQTATVSPI